MASSETSWGRTCRILDRHRLAASANSQVENEASSRQLPRDRNARRNASWAISSASLRFRQ